MIFVRFMHPVYVLLLFTYLSKAWINFLSLMPSRIPSSLVLDRHMGLHMEKKMTQVQCEKANSKQNLHYMYSNFHKLVIHGAFRKKNSEWRRSGHPVRKHRLVRASAFRAHSLCFPMLMLLYLYIQIYISLFASVAILITVLLNIWHTHHLVFVLTRLGDGKRSDLISSAQESK